MNARLAGALAAVALAGFGGAFAVGNAMSGVGGDGTEAAAPVTEASAPQPLELRTARVAGLGAAPPLAALREPPPEPEPAPAPAPAPVTPDAPVAPVAPDPAPAPVAPTPQPTPAPSGGDDIVIGGT